MATITAKDVAALRERTGAGMMDCKKALMACEGDVEKAIDYKTVCRRVVDSAPSLNELALVVISGAEMLCRLDRRFLCLLVSFKLICRHAGGNENKAHVVMVYADLFVNSLII